MNRFPFLGLAMLSLTALTPPSQTLAGGARQWSPNGNGTLQHEDDVQWIQFHDARITADPAKGLYSAAFGPFLSKMEGQHIAITGYILPVTTSGETTHFVLTRRSQGCPFCPPNEPTEAIEVFSQKFLKYTSSPITVEGRLHLVARSDQGLFYRIDAAKVF